MERVSPAGLLSVGGLHGFPLSPRLTSVTGLCSVPDGLCSKHVKAQVLVVSQLGQGMAIKVSSKQTPGKEEVEKGEMCGNRLLEASMHTRKSPVPRVGHGLRKVCTLSSDGPPGSMETGSERAEQEPAWLSAEGLQSLGELYFSCFPPSPF